MSGPLRHLTTRCVHAGETPDPHGALHTPLYNHSTFGFADTAAVLDVVEGRTEGALYTRYGLNPTIRSVEAKLADLEGGETALVFGSGMAAEAATFLAHAQGGDHLICVGDVYGGTFELLGENLPQLGISTTFLRADQFGELDGAFSDRTRLVFLETPTNPGLDVFDIAATARTAHDHGALLVVDNTFATPVNQRPLEHGADLVVHSATKYLGGHSDLTGGVVIGPSEHVAPLGVWRKNLGQVMAPEVAFLLARSLRSLVVRVEAQNPTAEAVARYLATHDRVLRVNHPALLEAEARAVVDRQMSGYGGMVSFVYDGDAEATAEVVDRLELFALGASLDGLVRLSCGLEHPDDLIADLERALG